MFSKILSVQHFPSPHALEFYFSSMTCKMVSEIHSLGGWVGGGSGEGGDGRGNLLILKLLRDYGQVL